MTNDMQIAVGRLMRIAEEAALQCTDMELSTRLYHALEKLDDLIPRTERYMLLHDEKDRED
jgi:hypothetical protein